MAILSGIISILPYELDFKPGRSLRQRLFNLDADDLFPSSAFTMTIIQFQFIWSVLLASEITLEVIRHALVCVFSLIILYGGRLALYLLRGVLCNVSIPYAIYMRTSVFSWCLFLQYHQRKYIVIRLIGAQSLFQCFTSCEGRGIFQQLVILCALALLDPLLFKLVIWVRSLVALWSRAFHDLGTGWS